MLSSRIQLIYDRNRLSSLGVSKSNFDEESNPMLLDVPDALIGFDFCEFGNSIKTSFFLLSLRISQNLFFY